MTNVESAKDTSLPGREEEVVINHPEVKQNEMIKDSITDDADLSIAAEKAFTEGLKNDSDTDVPIDTQ